MSDTRVGISEGDADDALLGRRTVLRGVAVGSVGIAALAACGSDDGGSQDTGSGYGGSGQSTEESEATEDGGEDGGGNEDGGGGTPLGPTSEVPVGGGVVYGDQEVVVTQPTEGEFLGFSAICTHQGCTLANVSDGTINCECHGSKFAIEDGSVANGPASSPLDTANVSVQGQQLMLG